MSDREVLNKAQKSTKTLEETLRLAKEAEEMGNNIMNDLNKQSEKLDNIKNTTKSIDPYITKSDKNLKNMSNRWYDPFGFFK